MIIKNNFIDPDSALLEKKFRRRSNWMSVSKEAGEWLQKSVMKKFDNFNLYIFVSDLNPIENSKINMYRGIMNRKIFKENKFSTFDIVRKGHVLIESKVIFYSILKIDIEYISNVVDYFRDQRDGFIFISKTDNLNFFPCEEIIKRRVINKDESIDSKSLVDFLIKKNFILIRVWGKFDDLFLSCEIYASPELKDFY